MANGPRRRAGARTAGSAAATWKPTEGALEQYFGALQGLPMLDAKQETALAREIEQQEIELWRALLSHGPALELVIGAVEPRLPSRAHELDALRRKRSWASRPSPRLASAITAAAAQLRKLDIDRSAVLAAQTAVRAALAQDGRARPYLARVEGARQAVQRSKASFVLANLRLVISMARRTHQSLMPFADLIQEGNLGLMRAVDRFDHRRGFRFSTYAAWWIRHGLNRALSDKARLVRIPVHALDDLSRVARASAACESKHGGTPSVAELASETGIPEDKLIELKATAVIRRPLSLDSGAGDDQERSLHDILPAASDSDPDQELDRASWREDLRPLLQELAPIESAILRFRFGLDDGEELTLRQIGQKYNLSRERIRQLQEVALAKLRDSIARRSQPGEVDDSVAA